MNNANVYLLICNACSYLLTISHSWPHTVHHSGYVCQLHEENVNHFQMSSSVERLNAERAFNHTVLFFAVASDNPTDVLNIMALLSEIYILCYTINFLGLDENMLSQSQFIGSD